MLVEPVLVAVKQPFSSLGHVEGNLGSWQLAHSCPKSSLLPNHPNKHHMRPLTLGFRNFPLWKLIFFPLIFYEVLNFGGREVLLKL